MEKPLVLLVDDNEATCTLVTALLQREFNVDVATDGVEAVAKLKTRTYSAILLDLRMPHLDGYGVLDFLQTERPELIPHVLILTASLSRLELERVRRYDIRGVVSKPFEIELLLAAVRQCAGSMIKGGPLLSGGMLILLEMLRHRLM